MATTASGFWEQAALEKADGAFAVVGSAFQNTLWATHALDAMLARALRSPRFSRVVVLACDRDPEEVRQFARSAAQTSEQGAEDKLVVVAEMDLTRTLADWAERPLDDKDEREVLVLLYSLSELCLLFGVRATLGWVQAFLAVPQRRVRLGCTLHQSLHSDEELALITSRFPVVARVIPNYGTMAETVAAEVQVVRRSAATGKVSEALELLLWGHGALEPRPAALQKKETAKQAPSGAKDVDLGPQVSAARLVTFDSTDPEFDDDEDADADLDL